jgi:hypothetical protein
MARIVPIKILMTTTPTIRKTISFPATLAERLNREAVEERRRFSPHVIKTLEDIFASKAVRHLNLKPKRK